MFASFSHGTWHGKSGNLDFNGFEDPSSFWQLPKVNVTFGRFWVQSGLSMPFGPCVDICTPWRFSCSKCSLGSSWVPCLPIKMSHDHNILIYVCSSGLFLLCYPDSYPKCMNKNHSSKQHFYAAARKTGGWGDFLRLTRLDTPSNTKMQPSSKVRTLEHHVQSCHRGTTPCAPTRLPTHPTR